MKKLICLLLITTQISHAANETRIKGSSITTGSASIGTSSAASSKAALDVVSTTKGAALPRMTTAQRDAITSPITGLEIYNTTLNQKQVYTGSAWVSVGAALGTASAPAASAVAESASTTQGILFPRMTTAQRDAISSPATGLVVYNTTTNHLNVYSGSAWVQFGAALGSASAPAASAVFEIASTTQGALFPRMTTTQRDNISSPATGLVVYNTTTSKFSFYSGTAWVDVGSGSGGGSINYVLNADAEAGLASVAAYADAAGTSPVDGTGGSPTLTVTQTSSSPLTGLQSFLITKDAANRQGEGVAWDFTIDRSALAKQHTVSFDYEVASGTYDAGSDTTDSDLTAWVYGPTDGTPVLTQLTSYKVLGCGSGVTCRFQGNFQTAASGVAYRLILHEAKTGTSAYTVKVDSVSVSPVLRTFGAPITDPKSYTPTIGGQTSPTVFAQYWREGKFLVVTGYSNGTNTTTDMSVSLPSGLVIDSTVTGTRTNTPSVGKWSFALNATATRNWQPLFFDGSDTANVYAATNEDSASNQWQKRTGTSAIGAAYTFVFEFKVPISGWGSTVQLSQDDDGRVVAARGTNTAGTSIADVTDTLIPLVVTFDTHGAQLATTGVYTAPVPGKYRFDGVITFQDSLGVGTTVDLIFKKNGSTVRVVRTVSDEAGSQYWSASGSDVADLNAGDTIGVYARQNSGTSKVLSSTTGHNTFSITRLSGSASIAASETVAAGYYLNADTAFNSTQINYDTKDYDTHNAVTTGASWKFTAPMAGIYTLCATNYYSAGSLSDVIVRKNGTNYARIAQVGTSVTSSYPGCIDIKLAGAEYIDLITNASITFKGLISSVRTTFVNIKRVGI